MDYRVLRFKELKQQVKEGKVNPYSDDDKPSKKGKGKEEKKGGPHCEGCGKKVPYHVFSANNGLCDECYEDEGGL